MRIHKSLDDFSRHLVHEKSCADKNKLVMNRSKLEEALLKRIEIDNSKNMMNVCEARAPKIPVTQLNDILFARMRNRNQVSKDARLRC